MKLVLTRDDLIELIQADGRFQVDEELDDPVAEYFERVYKNKKMTYKKHTVEVDEAFTISFDLKESEK